MSSLPICKNHSKKDWRVLVRHGNYSHFQAPKGAFHPSAYSLVTCVKCGRAWRTKADYVEELKDYE